MCGFVTETPVHVVPGTNLLLKVSLLRMENVYSRQENTFSFIGARYACTYHASTLARSRTASLGQLRTHVHIQAASHAISLHNPQTYKRISSRSTPVSAEAGLDSQPFARKSRLTAAAGTPRKRDEASH